MQQEQFPARPLSLQTVASFARETTLKENGHVPMLLAEGDRGMVVALFEQPPAQFELRLLAMYSAGLTMAKRDQIGILHQVFFISEAWMSVGEKPDKPPIRPTEDPDRKEVLIVYETRMQDLGSEVVVYEIDRNERERVADLQEFETPGSEEGTDDVESPLLDAFIAGYLIGVGGNYN